MIKISNILSNDKFLQNLKNKNIQYIPLEEYKGINTCINFKCKKNHIFKSIPRAIYDGQGCPYCSHNKVLKGYNDLWTTHPHIANLLKDKNVGYDVSFQTHKKADFICPNCNSLIKNKSIKYVVKNNYLRCDYCFDKKSYPEKFISNMLKQLNIKFVYDNSFEWSNKKRYDFYIEELSLIIETHGIQHYVNSFGSINIINQYKNDEYKEQLALSNGIQNYIQLDCRISSKEYIKKSIFDSNLSKIFDLKSIDWDECELNSCKSDLINVCNMWDNGTQNVFELSEIFKLDRHTITNYLKRGSDLNICSYNVDEENKKRLVKMCNINKKRVLRINDNKIFDSVSEVCKIYGYKNQSISACCRGERKTAYGQKWKYID